MFFSGNCNPVLVQQNIDGSDFFNRSWAEFKVGFNDSEGNYWIGNDLLSQLTQSGPYKLRVELQARSNLTWYWAEYSRFVVYNESQNYELEVSGNSGNAGDGLEYQNGMLFTTYDRDNDPFKNYRFNNNCAVRDGGGFWYKACATGQLNARRGNRHIDRTSGTGADFRWWSRQVGHLWLQSSRMWLKC